MMESLFAERVFGIPYTALAASALAVSIVFLVVEINTTGSAGFRWIVLRWFHSVCWVLLAVAALLRAKLAPGTEAFAGPAAIAGGLVYATYLITMLTGGP